jgi:hypothetical protein
MVRQSISLDRTLWTWKARLPGPLKKRGANCRIRSITVVAVENLVAFYEK